MSDLTDTYIGFDSAWTDNEKAPGAICSVQLKQGRPLKFSAPRLARFSEAVAFIEASHAGSDFTLIAVDQPTIVPNFTSMRPAERVAASVISWVGGGVQPANRNKVGMFCDASPIWPFLRALSAEQDPPAAREATTGKYVIEVYPALALTSLNPCFFRRLGGPRYNPANWRRFKLDDWQAVCATAAEAFGVWGLTEPAGWCRDAKLLTAPRKADQDRLDAMLCLLIALHWRLQPVEESIMIGDLHTGYIVAPASAKVRERLESAAKTKLVPIDGACVSPFDNQQHGHSALDKNGENVRA